ncbi:MAG: hypothetical protein H0W61_00285 [Bacteroidetes bacterium]|nr:hypothetical protein [Bacteroidota bacterium]
MNNLAFTDFTEYLKMLFGLQDDHPGSFFSRTCIEPTYNWDNGSVKDFLYNDNRIVIRIHSLFHFIAFKSYFVHALFSCFLSFIGSFFIYKSVKAFFNRKEVPLIIVITLFPTLWLYTGGLLKEGLTLFFLGMMLWCIKNCVNDPKKISGYLMLPMLLFISLLLKPYVLFYCAVVYSLFFILEKRSLKFKSLWFLSSLIFITLLVNFGALLMKDQGILQAAKKREKDFMDLSTGGIFLMDSVKFVRVPYDTTLVKRVKNKKDHYTIKEKVTFTYWEHSHQKDTLYCPSNPDTSTIYSLVYILPKAGSTVNVINGSSNFFIIGLRSLYYTTLHPFFYNAKGIMQQFASLENLLLCICFLISIVGIFSKGADKFPGIVFLFYGLSLFILIGFTTPNSGAIMRYRAPGAVFILMSALYFFDKIKFVFREKFN